MRSWFDWVMNRRAASLTERLRQWMPPGSHVADVGSGTGHNAHSWRAHLGVTVDEFDVADLHWVGAGPIIFDGRKLSVANAAYDVVTLLFVLQYSPQVLELLEECRRITHGRVLLIQSTYRGKWGRFWLRLREFFWGPLAYHAARMFRVIRGQSCPLNSRKMFSLDELTDLIQQAGFQICHWEPQPWTMMWISRDLFVLEPVASPSTCRSSSPPAMKCAG